MLARLEMPILNGDLPFTWLCWAEMKRADFVRASELWDVQGRESEPPYTVSVATALPYPQGTLGLRAQMITRALGQRPLLVLDQVDHPLYAEQAHGVSMQRVQEIVERALHEA